MFDRADAARWLVSKSAGRDRTIDSRASVSSSEVTGASLILLTSFMISPTAGPVTSVRMPVET